MSPRKNLARPLRLAARYDLLPESRGQELLREVPESNKTIASALGVTAPAVNQWRHGYSRPSDERARALEAHFGVPYASWFVQSDALRAALAKYGAPPADTRPSQDVAPAAATVRTSHY